jgi:N-acyl-D-aspartate/D-glutamate deacylase
MNPICHSQVAQGITTEISGNCGYSPFPLLDNNRGLLLDPDGVDLPWLSAEGFSQLMTDKGMGINCVPQVGHITVRAAVLNREDRPATPGETERMKELVRAAMKGGARGLSTGLDYAPTKASDLEELVELVEVVAEHGGFYTSHVRGYTDQVLNAIAEAIEVGRRTGVPVQISHIGVSGRDNWGRAPRMLYLMDKARRDGVQVACDMMAYRTSGAWWGPRAVLPKHLYDWHLPWPENLHRIRQALASPSARAELREEIEYNRQRPKRGFQEEALIFGDWRDIHIKELPGESRRQHLVGMDMAAAAHTEGREAVDLFLNLLADEGEEFAAVRFSKSEDDFRTLLAYDWSMFCTDTVGTAINLLDQPWNTIQPHRRHYGTFPRVLARFVRDERILTLEEAVRRMSALPAEQFDLAHRGYIREGYWADLVVVDMQRVAEKGTWRIPAAYPEGIDEVFVNGVHAIEKGKFTGQLGGQMLHR